ncbi:MAG TPA: VTT domain-containing protein [Chloroflexota bacterium]|jgi:membrane protein DedA with SNARE-associated domain
MSGLEAFLDTYGLAAACVLMLVKAIGVPIPVPGDVILLGVAARAADGKVLLWVAFAGLLLAIVLGGLLQFMLARGPARRFVVRYGARLGLTPERMDVVGRRVRQGGPVAIGLGVLTPGVRTAVIPACGLTGIPLSLFLPGLILGSAVDLALHFVIGFVGASLLTTVSPLALLLVLAIVGLGVTLYIARRRRMTTAAAVTAWTQATCPVCLALEAARPMSFDPAVRWESAA